MGKLNGMGLICSALSLTLIIVSTAVPYWHEEVPKEDRSIDNSHLGLWMSCSKFKAQKEAFCEWIIYTYEYILVARAFVLLGLFLVAGASILGFILTCVDKANPNIGLVAGLIANWASTSMLIAIIVYAVRTPALADEGITIRYHAGFALAIIAMVAALVAGLSFIVGRCTYTKK